jgi:hypothetical protein
MKIIKTAQALRTLEEHKEAVIALQRTLQPAMEQIEDLKSYLPMAVTGVNGMPETFVNNNFNELLLNVNNIDIAIKTFNGNVAVMNNNFAQYYDMASATSRGTVGLTPPQSQ